MENGSAPAHCPIGSKVSLIHKLPKLWTIVIKHLAYNSGAQKRKLKVKRNKQIEEVISQIPKLTNYFSSSRQSANVLKNETDNNIVEILTSGENETLCENVIIEQLNYSNPKVKNNVPIEKGKNDDSELHKLNTENTNTIENEPTVESDMSKSFIGFENDVGIWPQSCNNKMITFWIKQGSTNLQNCDEKLLETKPVQQDRADRSAHNDLSSYWRIVLKRVVSTIKFIAERGLAFRGDNEIIGSRNELIDLIAKEVLSKIITRIKKSKYFSVSVDSTSGINPVERFLTFVPNCNHTGIKMANTFITFLDHHKIELNDCREFIPCCGHSLNLVGKTVANSCVAAIRFFDFIQNLYNLNETRWSCRADATKAVVFGYDYTKEALVEISNDLDQKDIVKIQSKKLYE
ncbi:hypothetical protein QTP88_027781 [Uroleucon formosanum]